MKWFKHSSSSNLNAKLQELVLECGFEGYGVYWYCLELIADNVEAQKLTFQLEHDERLIARYGGISVGKVREIMMHMINIGLFEKSNGEVTCLELAKICDDYTAKLVRRNASQLIENKGVRQSPTNSEKVPLEQNRTDKKRTDTTLNSVDNFFHEKSLYWHQEIPFSESQRNKVVESFLTNELSNQVAQQILDETTGQLLAQKVIDRPFGLIIRLGMLAKENRFTFSEHGQAVQKQRNQLLQAQQKQRA